MYHRGLNRVPAHGGNDDSGNAARSRRYFTHCISTILATWGKRRGQDICHVAVLGQSDDEAAAAQELDRLAPPLLHDAKGSGAGGRKKKKKSKARKGVAASDALPPSSSPISREGMPDIVLLGDVAYQHKPGSFSHFEALMSTVLRFTDEHTLVIFGTRCRMPASADLLEMFRLHFHEVIEPILAHEISDSFSHEKLGRRHNISIHLLRRKKETETSVNAAEVSEVE